MVYHHAFAIGNTHLWTYSANVSVTVHRTNISWPSLGFSCGACWWAEVRGSATNVFKGHHFYETIKAWAQPFISLIGAEIAIDQLSLKKKKRISE